MGETPLRERKVYCPSCGKSSTISYLPPLTSRLYVAKEKEEDQHVTRWEWKNPLWQNINPYYYSIWLCPLCYYADFEEDFIKDRTNPSNKIFALKPLLLEEKSKDSSVINFLGERLIGCAERDFKAAVISFLLTIYIQELISEIKQDGEYRLSRDWKKLGRLYLRLSWLFGEKQQNKGQVANDFFSDIFKEIDGLRKNVALSQGSLKKVQDAAERFKKDEEAQGKQDERVSEQARRIFETMESSFDGVAKSITQLQIVLRKNEEAEGSASHHDDELKRFKDFMIELTAFWPEAPGSEREALDKAIMYFTTTAENDSYLSAMASFKMSEFVVLLYQKINKEREALECLRQIAKKASDYRAKLFRKKSKATSAVDKIQIDEEVTRLNAYIQEISYKAKVKQQ